MDVDDDGRGVVRGGDVEGDGEVDVVTGCPAPVVAVRSRSVGSEKLAPDVAPVPAKVPLAEVAPSPVAAVLCPAATGEPCDGPRSPLTSDNTPQATRASTMATMPTAPTIDIERMPAAPPAPGSRWRPTPGSIVIARQDRPTVPTVRPSTAGRARARPTAPLRPRERMRADASGCERMRRGGKVTRWRGAPRG